MKHPEPPRLALRLLERLSPDGSTLAGDLVEEFHRGRSRRWLWWQVVAAVAIGWFNRPDEIRPLYLVDLQPTDAQERTRRLSLRFPQVNLSASPVHGVGGLGILILGGLVTLLMPTVWLVMLASVVAGLLLGIAMIVSRRSRAPRAGA